MRYLLIAFLSVGSVFGVQIKVRAIVPSKLELNKTEPLKDAKVRVRIEKWRKIIAAKE